jgi:RNA polymerase sigma-70 factor (ECF subfamily)
MFSVLITLFGFEHSSLVEDIIQESFVAALKTWRVKGVPENPKGWLIQVSKNKLINELKKRSNRARLNKQFANEHLEEKVEELFLETHIKDSQLRALFSCCHPLLKPKEQIMLTLKVLSGFSDTEIAQAFFSTPEAVKKAIYRAKKVLQDNDVTFNVPSSSEMGSRIKTVHTIIYLMFNEGYKQTTGEALINEDLCFQASRLAILLTEIEGDHKAETYALLSLIYFSIARFPTRSNESGEMIELEFQDRSKWDQEIIKTAAYFLRNSRSTKRLSKYHLEATIASIHCTADSYGKTDWETISICYYKLLEMEKNLVLNINYAIAISKWKGPKEGLLELEQVESAIKKPLKYLFYSAKASMLMQFGNFDLARSYYQVARDLAKHEMDRSFLLKKIEECDRKGLRAN